MLYNMYLEERNYNIKGQGGEVKVETKKGERTELLLSSMEIYR
jgi:hypothetical protein